MRAVVCRRYGPPEVARIEEVATPAVRDDEILIAVRATTVSAADSRLRSATFPAGWGVLARAMMGVRGLRQPILGMEFAGDVSAVGKDVTRFKVGEKVWGGGVGFHAEYRAIRETAAIAPLPDGMSYDEAAAIPFGGQSALTILRDRGRVKAGDKVLVNGAAGSVGSAVVQLAKHFGAEVTAVCSAANLDLVRSIGADKAIDYAQDDPIGTGETYDIIFDAVGALPIFKARRALKQDGRLLLAVAGLPQILQALLASAMSRRKVIAAIAIYKEKDLRFLAELAAAGSFRPVVGRRYPLDQIAEAHRYADTGHKRGNVVITMDHQA
jgi:NADPH:quinone reductase-like Zn-dependent oxidoreductase